MGNVKRWAEVEDGVGVFWEGLALQEILPLSPEERTEAAGSWSRRMRMNWGWAALVAFLSISGLSFWRPWSVLYFAGSAAVLVLCFAGLALAAHLKRPGFGNKAVFQGDFGVLPKGTAFAGALKREGVTEGEVVAEVLPDLTLWSLNGRRLGRRVVEGRVVRLEETGHAGDDRHLSDAERTELRLNMDRACVWPCMIRNFGFSFFVANACLGGSGPPQERLCLMGTSVLFWVAGSGRSISMRNRLQLDVAEGELVAEGDRRILKHSRKPWTVGGKPAKWRANSKGMRTNG